MLMLKINILVHILLLISVLNCSLSESNQINQSLGFKDISEVRLKSDEFIRNSLNGENIQEVFQFIMKEFENSLMKYDKNNILNNESVSSCSTFLNSTMTSLKAKLTFKIQDMPEMEDSFIRKSGLFMDQLGTFNSCDKTPGMYMVTFAYTLGFMPVIGPMAQNLCIPKTCLANDLNEIITQTLLPAQIYVTTNVTGLQSLIHWTNRQQYNYTMLSFIIVTSLFLIIAILLTSISQYKKNNLENKKYLETKNMIKDLGSTQYNDEENLGGKDSINKPTPAFKMNNTSLNYDSLNKEKDSSMNFANKETKLPSLSKNDQLVTKIKMPENLKEKCEPTFFERLMECFDMIKRFESIKKSKRASPESAAFDMMRVISMCWVVIAHSFLIGLDQTLISIDMYF